VTWFALLVTWPMLGLTLSPLDTVVLLMLLIVLLL
jgi:hypothetical protein